MILLTFTRHSSLRIAELGFALVAVAGVVLFLAAIVPGGRRPGNLLAGLLLVIGAVVVIVAIHFGRFG